MVAYSHANMDAFWRRWNPPKAPMLLEAPEMILLNLLLPHPVAILTPEEACACGHVDTMYESAVNRLSVEPQLKAQFPHILPDASNGEYETPWVNQNTAKKGSNKYSKRVKPERDPDPLPVEEFRNLDRFEDSGRPPLTLWCSFKAVAPSGQAANRPQGVQTG